MKLPKIRRSTVPIRRARSIAIRAMELPSMMRIGSARSLGGRYPSVKRTGGTDAPRSPVERRGRR